MGTSASHESRSAGFTRPGANAGDAEDGSLWYKDAIVYEVHVRAFYDANGDGTGDFDGLTRRLDYLQDLGVTAIWLLPFYESPLRDDGYDIADYRKIHPAYGTMRDFQRFLKEAHARGLRVITELVLNHTSDQHGWFQRARTAPPGSAHRDYYVWSETAAEYSSARIIFKDFERSNWTWDPVAQAYFWHRFYSHQPDLNFDNPRVREEMLDVIDFWLEKGVDGLRLDAVPYLFEREATSCENLPETHEFLKQLRDHIDRKFPGRMLLAEANQWPDDAAAYFGDGDECHMAFHFPLMPRLFMAVRMEDRFPITEILEQTPAIPESSQWALFLRNHDELTLEMVTDEERDYMYRVYAGDDRARINFGIRRRLTPLLWHNRRLIELMNALLLSMKGTPVIYYGDEIGMGDNIYLGDRNSVRTPMQWSADRNAGFSRANPQELYLPIVIDPEYHYEAVNVDAQQSSPSLLLWWMKRIIGLRKRHAAFGRGSMTFVDTDNRRVLAFLREYEGERLLVVANLSRFAQGVHLSLNSAAGEVPVELFGQGRFPPVTDAPYFLSLGPHGFFWFALEPVAEPMIVVGEGGAPTLRATGHWSTAFDARRRRPLEAALAAYAPSRRWFAGKSRHLRRLTVAEVVPLRRRGTTLANFVLLRAEYVEGEPELYAIILTAVTAERAAQLERDTPWALVCRVETEGEAEYLVDGLAVPEVASALLEWFRARRSFPANGQSLTFATVGSGRQLLGAADFDASPAVHRGEQNNTSLMFGNRLVLKFIRRVEYGPHPQVEVGLALGESPVAAHVPAVVGTLSFGTVPRHSATVAVLEDYVPHQCDAWTFAVDELTRFVEEVAADQADPPTIPRVSHPLDLDAPPQALVDRAGPWLDFARLLGQRTGELHLALAQRLHDPDFSPEPFTPFYQRALAQGFGLRVRQTMRLLRGEPPGISDATVALARTVARSEEQLLRRLRAVATRRLQGKRIRLHGDLRLGQVLVAGHDAIFIDFEGEPTRSLGDRRVKRSPFRDVVGMVRSFDDAAKTVLRSLDASIQAGTANIARVEAWIQAWDRWTAAVYVQSYLHTVTDSSDLLGRDTEEHHFLLDAFALDRALEQVRYELDNRPDRVEIPLREVAEFIDGDSDDS